MSADENLQRMKTLDDAWNAQNWAVFRKHHSADTRGLLARSARSDASAAKHTKRSPRAFFKSIENHLENNPYRVMFGSGDWTCTIAPVEGQDDWPLERAGRQGA